ncbi:hypothetical protein [Levilactobacillus mulengensis]|uniref:hypothetical protein n=1 Tax=Levilactobacillus mulengensis TaxID=2486025 RepID=UPI000F774B71|nr:hypothetical protein [Levilactobacillus mulengensis]
MKNKLLKTLLIFGLIVGVFLGMDTQKANASKRYYVTTPKSLRGTWYSVVDGSLFQRVTITKYKFETERMRPSTALGNMSITLSGKHFSSGLHHPDLAVAAHKSAKGYWTLGGANFGGIYHFKKWTKDTQGNATLREWLFGDESGVDIRYYYSRKSMYPRVKALREKKVLSWDDFVVN